MSTVWSFLVQNRRKLVVGGIAAGAAYLIQKYLRSVTNDQLHSERQLTDSGALVTRSRKHFIFDSNQQTCDSAILLLLPKLAETLKEKFNIEASAEQLRSGSGDKLGLWNRMKSDCLARLMSLAYAYMLVTVTMKAQMNILAKRIWLTAADQRQASRTGLLAGLVGGANRPEEPDEETDHLFLQSIQYFLRVGVMKLVERIDHLTTTRVSRLSLKDSVTLEQLAELLSEIRAEIDANDCRMFSYFVVPLSADKDAFGLGNPQLEILLVELRQVLESNACRLYFSKAIDQWFCAIMELCRDASRGKEPLPLVKLIPILTDTYEHLRGTDTASNIGLVLQSDELRQFCVGIFNSD